jgi:hypothetical protein
VESCGNVLELSFCDRTVPHVYIDGRTHANGYPVSPKKMVREPRSTVLDFVGESAVFEALL